MRELQLALPTREQWQALDTATIADWVQQRGGSTVLVVEGTRRWYQFTYLRGAAPPADPADYMRAGAAAQVALIELLLAHGLGPLYIPLIVPLDRGQRYAQQMLARGIPALLDQPRLAALLARARVRYYGAWPQLPLEWGAARAALDLLRGRFAVWSLPESAADAPLIYFHIDTGGTDLQEDLLTVVAQLGAQLGRMPTRAEIVAAYYHSRPGEQPGPINIFLSSELQVSRFMPPLLGGAEEPYFTTESLLALDAGLLRRVLYDYVFLRHGPPGTAEGELERYDDLAPQQRAALARWQATRRYRALGLGARHEHGAFWYPLLDGSGMEHGSAG